MNFCFKIGNGCLDICNVSAVSTEGFPGEGGFGGNGNWTWGLPRPTFGREVPLG